MALGIKVDFLWFSIGTGDFFHSFFSTVAVNLENRKWGSRFPTIMKNMYSGKLSVEELTDAEKELIEIKKELSEISPDKVVWDAEDLSKMPPWGDNISNEIHHLSDYFVTSGGKNLIDTMLKAIHEAQVEKVDLEVKNL